MPASTPHPRRRAVLLGAVLSVAALAAAAAVGLQPVTPSTSTAAPSPTSGPARSTPLPDGAAAVEARRGWDRTGSFAGADVRQRGDGVLVVPQHRNGRLAVYVHGASQHGTSAVDNQSTARITKALVEAGYVVAASDAGGNAWGSAASIAEYGTLIDTVKQAYGLGRVYVVAESMGGLAGARLAARDDVRAWAGVFPVCNVASLTGPDLLAQISAVWPSGAPAWTSPVRWPHKPVTVWASAEDTTVPARSNGWACGAVVGATIVHTRGQHGDRSNYDGAAVVELFGRH